MTETTTETRAAEEAREEADRETAERVRRAARVVLDTLLEQGLAWAEYGLRVGRLALETKARTMHALADSLGRLAEALKRPEPGEPLRAEEQAPS
jgi:hypothetical protein